MTRAFLQSMAVNSRLIQQLDPRIKILTAVFVILGVVMTPPSAWLAYPLLWTLIGCMAAISHINVWHLNRLAGLALPFTLTAITLIVTTPGQAVINIAGFTVTDVGLARFLEIVLESWLSIQVSLLLTLTTSFPDLLWGLESLRVPATLVAIMGFMYRYLSTLKDEAARLLRARAARSGTNGTMNAGGSLHWRARITGGMVGNLFLRSYERSERVHAAMLARGYSGQLKRQQTTALNWQSLLFAVIPAVCIFVIHRVSSR
jgi:cobalt/nickel transport system permease protein